METETCKLYSGVFWIILPNFIKIDRYNFELYRFKVGAFFETQCSCGFHQHLNLPLEEGNLRMEYADCSFADTSVSVRLSYWSPINGTSTLMPLRSSGIFKSLAWSNIRFSWMCFRCHWLLLLSIIGLDQTIIGMRLSKTSVISWACWIRLLISNGSRSMSLAGESSS